VFLSSFFLSVMLVFANPASARSAENEFFTPEADKEALANSTATEEGLPKVLILGDSISIGYFPIVKQTLQGEASVSRPNTNCGDTPRGLRHLEQWLGNTKWDVIHFNRGLWDLCYRKPIPNNPMNRDMVDGKTSATPEEYQKNLATLVDRLQKNRSQIGLGKHDFCSRGRAGKVCRGRCEIQRYCRKDHEGSGHRHQRPPCTQCEFFS